MGGIALGQSGVLTQGSSALMHMVATVVVCCGPTSLLPAPLHLHKNTLRRARTPRQPAWRRRAANREPGGDAPPRQAGDRPDRWATFLLASRREVLAQRAVAVRPGSQPRLSTLLPAACWSPAAAHPLQPSDALHAC